MELYLKDIFKIGLYLVEKYTPKLQIISLICYQQLSYGDLKNSIACKCYVHWSIADGNSFIFIT